MRGPGEEGEETTGDGREEMKVKGGNATNFMLQCSIKDILY